MEAGSTSESASDGRVEPATMECGCEGSAETKGGQEGKKSREELKCGLACNPRPILFQSVNNAGR